MERGPSAAMPENGLSRIIIHQILFIQCYEVKAVRQRGDTLRAGSAVFGKLVPFNIIMNYIASNLKIRWTEAITREAR
jgi:hypothetical protein